MSASDVNANEYDNELRRSKRCITETRFGPNFVTTFLTEDFDIDTLNDELVSICLIEEDLRLSNEFNRCNILKRGH